jgi:hypothetical protein
MKVTPQHFRKPSEIASKVTLSGGVIRGDRNLPYLRSRGIKGFARPLLSSYE